MKAVMSALDVDRHSFISAKDLYKFLKGEGVNIDEQETELFVSIYDSNSYSKKNVI